MPRRPAIFGFGPIGYALLAPLAALIWVAATGYDLQHEVLRCIDAAAGWEGLFYFITRIYVGHYFSLRLPIFGLIAYCIVILAFHFAPNQPARWHYAGLLGWAIIAPMLPWISLDIRPASISPNSWRLLCQGISLGGAATLLALATRSWIVGLTVGLAGAAGHGLALLDGVLFAAGARRGLIFEETGFYGWHIALAAALTWWVVGQWSKIRPEHHCQACGYDLRGLAAGAQCPECGATDAAPAGASPAAPRAPADAPAPPAPAAP